MTPSTLTPLQQCIASGQVDSKQMAAHEAEGGLIHHRPVYQKSCLYASHPGRVIKSPSVVTAERELTDEAQAERKEFDKLHMRGEGAPSFRVWSKWNEHEKRIAWEAWLARAELASQQEAAAPVTDAELLKLYQGDDYGDTHQFALLDFARAVVAASRVPVASPGASHD